MASCKSRRSMNGRKVNLAGRAHRQSREIGPYCQVRIETSTPSGSFPRVRFQHPLEVVEIGVGRIVEPGIVAIERGDAIDGFRSDR